MVAEPVLEAMRAALSRCGVAPGARLVVGVSGGVDSLTLLDGLHRLGYAVIAAHYHHGLRAEADEDEATVRAVARRLGVPFVSERGAVAAQAAAARLSLEAAGREARYRFLFAAAAAHHAEAVVVGHTADDQVETVLLHVLRGSGIHGLAGLSACLRPTPWSEERPLLRPLVAVPRAATVAYCRRRGLPVRWDVSNWQRRYARNRLRLDVLPRLRAENPAVDAALRRLAAIAAAEDDFIAAEAARRWPEVVAYEGQRALAFWRLPFLKAHVALQRRWLQTAAARLGVGEVGFEAVERVRSGARRPGGLHPWVQGRVWWAEARRLWLLGDESALPVTLWPQLPDGEAFALAPEVPLTLPGGWRLVVSAPQALPANWRTGAHLTAPWVDAEALTSPLTVRPLRPGDRLAPLGMGGHHRKVSDLLAERGIPRPLRSRWPLVWAAGKVVWVPWVAISHDFRITHRTTRAVRLTLFAPEDFDGTVPS